MGKMRLSSLDTGAAWCGGCVNLGASNPRVYLRKLLLSSCEWLFHCEDQRIHPISHSSCTARADGHRLHYVILGDSGCQWLGMPAETAERAVQNHQAFRKCV